MIASGRFDDRTLTDVLNALPLAVIGLDASGRVTLWNPGAEQTTGWKASDVLGALPPLEIPSPTPQHLETRLIRKDGGEVDLLIHSIPWTNSRGEGLGSLLFIRDLTARRANERLMRDLTVQEEQARSAAREHLRFRELLEAAPDAIIEVAQDGRIVLMNEVTEQLFGYTRTELLNQPVEILIPNDLRGSHHRHRSQYWNHPSTRPMGTGLKLEGQRKDGSRFPVEISLSPVKSEDGFRVSAIIRDVTERKLAEEKLQAIQAAHTEVLTQKNQELEARNLQIERADRMKSEFLSGMSHELRTPLHTIIGFTELLREELEGPLNPKQHRFLEHIHRDSQHLLALINDVLDLSKIESGRLELQRAPFAIEEALEDTISSVQPRAAAKTLKLEVVGTSTHEIYADPLRFKQILYNLLSNAVKFTPDGGGIRIEIQKVQEFVEIAVVDSGIGIPESEQDSVFDKFYQVGQRQAGGHEGTGLGLAITRHLVEQHGGRMKLESAPGQGSRFSFTMPLSQQRAVGH